MTSKSGELQGFYFTKVGCMSLGTDINFPRPSATLCGVAFLLVPRPSTKYMSRQCLKSICLKGYQSISCWNHPQAYIWSNLGQLLSFIPQHYSRCHGPYTFGEKRSGKPERECHASAGCSSLHSDWLPVTGKKKKNKPQLNVRLFTKYINLKIFLFLYFFFWLRWVLLLCAGFL